MIRRQIPLLLFPLFLMACSEQAPSEATPADAPASQAESAPAEDQGTRPMDEVPDRSVLDNGDRRYGFDNGCEIIIEATRAVVKTESSECELHHRDIALLYAAGD